MMYIYINIYIYIYTHTGKEINFLIVPRRRGTLATIPICYSSYYEDPKWHPNFLESGI